MRFDKRLKVLISVAAVIAILYFLRGVGKVDDWQYTGEPVSNVLGILLKVGIGLVVGWFAYCTYLIATGKPLRGHTNPRRIVGIMFLSGPIALIAVAFGLLLLINEYYNLSWIALVLPVLVLAYVVWLIVYAVRKKVKLITLIPLSIMFLILIAPVALLLISNMFSSTSMAFSENVGSTRAFSKSAGMPQVEALSSAGKMASDSIGLSVGGAKDINNFRANIKNNYLPLPTDITYEGLFYDYYFDTGATKTCEKLFCPSYTDAVTEDPFSRDEEYYLSVGLNSGIKESDFKRKKLNLVIVLDISGSMGSSFNKYYYDRFGKRVENEDRSLIPKSKMKVANEAVVELLDHLRSDDRFGMVLFESRAHVAKPLNMVGDTDMYAIKDHILEITDSGGTNMEAGYKAGTGLFDEYLDSDPLEYENRIIFLTDAMPNTGQISEEGLFGLADGNAEKGIYTTFIGIGVDFNTELIEEITKTRGANYYSVHNSKEFMKRMDEEFEYMVTPIVFNLKLELDAQGYDIEKVYGSPEADEATGEIMKVNTLFPSSREDGETKGGIVVLKLEKTSEDASLHLKASYENRAGTTDKSVEEIDFTDKSAEYFDNTGIRKGILLSRYASLIKNWISDERSSLEQDKPVVPVVNEEDGIVVPRMRPLGQWERQSVELDVSEEYKELFSDFKDYYVSEAEAIGDDDLMKEVEVLDLLIGKGE